MMPLKIGHFIGCPVVSMIIQMQMLYTKLHIYLLAPEGCIFFIVDALHLMKTARNALYHPGILKWFCFEIAS